MPRPTPYDRPCPARIGHGTLHRGSAYGAKGRPAVRLPPYRCKNRTAPTPLAALLHFSTRYVFLPPGLCRSLAPNRSGLLFDTQSFACAPTPLAFRLATRKRGTTCMVVPLNITILFNNLAAQNTQPHAAYPAAAAYSGRLFDRKHYRLGGGKSIPLRIRTCQRKTMFTRPIRILHNIKYKMDGIIIIHP